jgi:tetratricopeptide (TPR) repeat protein
MRNEAVSTLEEAVAIYGRLSRQRPNAFLLRLAMSLNGLSASLNQLGRHEDALTHSEAALQILYRISGDSPDVFRKEIAGTLINIGVISNALGLEGKAETAFRESIALHRKLAEQQPNAFAPPLHLALNNLGQMLRKRGRLDEAGEVLEEAAGIGRRFVEPRPDSALSLFNLGLVRRDIGDPAGASALFEESIRALRPFFLREPASFREWMQVIVRLYRRHEESRGRIPDSFLVTDIEKRL